MTIQGLLFDKDGTLISFTPLWPAIARDCACQLVASGNVECDVTVDRLLAAIGVQGESIDPQGILAVEPVSATAAAWYALLQPAIPAAAFAQQVSHMMQRSLYAHPQWLAAIADVPAQLRLWRAQGYRLGVATADNQDSTRFCLAHTGLLELFDFIGTSDGELAAKPDPALLHAFCNETGLRPQQVIMFGDTPSDMAFGRNAGAFSVGVLSGTATSAELAPLAHGIVPSVADFDPARLPWSLQTEGAYQHG